MLITALLRSVRILRWLCDTKFPKVFRTLLSILADLKIAVVWIISIILLFLPRFWSFQVHQPQSVSLSSLFSTVFLFSGKVQVFDSGLTFFKFR